MDWAAIQSRRSVLITIGLVSSVLVIALTGYSYHLLNSQLGESSQTLASYQELQESHDLLRGKFEEVIKRNEGLSAEMEGLQGTVDQFEVEKRTILGQIQNSMAGFEEEREANQRQLSTLKEELGRIESENLTLQEQVLSAQDSSVQEQTTLASQIQSLEAKVQAYEEQVGTLEEQIFKKHSSQGVPATLHYNLGNFFFRKQRFEEAAQEYRNSLAYRPDDADTHFNLGLTYEHYLHDPLNAVVHYKQYLALAPDAVNFNRVQEKVLDLEFREAILLGEPWDPEALSPVPHVREQEFRAAKNYKNYR